MLVDRDLPWSAHRALLASDSHDLPGASTQGQPSAEVRPRPGTELVDLTTSTGERVVALFGPALTARRPARPQCRASPDLDLLLRQRDVPELRARPSSTEFRRLGLNVLIPDYVGYGMSGGSPSEKGCQATADAAYDYLVSTRGIDPRRIIAAGWSLGGAVAIDLASRRQVGGLIAFSSFTSGVDMARRMLPFVPVSLLLRHRFDSIDKIARSPARS